MTELASGSSLGRYELLVPIGQGGMASVWVARERAPMSGKQRLVAVKAMLPELARRPDFRSMFLEEGQIVRSIDHSHVVKIHEVAEDRSILYMAMEWVEGESLRALIRGAKKRGAIPPEMAVRVIADAAAGLHAAHELRGWDGELRGVVHCDVSPHNILIGMDGKAKIVDFGVAHAIDQLADLEGGPSIKGKFGYMSPEQAQGRSIDRRSDVFSLGIVLFELTTGERLFRGRDDAHTLELVSWGKLPRPSQLNRRYPPRLEAIVMRALARDVEHRYQTADELRVALERYLVDERIMVSRSSVGQLLRRVLGTRIEQRRDAIRDALAKGDGEVHAGLVPSESLAVADGEGSYAGQDVVADSVSQTSIPDYALSSIASYDMQSSPSGTPLEPTASGTPRPHAFEQQRTRRGRSPVLFVAGAVLGIAAGGVGAWIVQARYKSRVQDFGSAAATAAASAGGPSDKPAQESGLSVDSLPEIGDPLPPALPERGAAPAARPERREAAAKEEKKEEPPKTAIVELEEGEAPQSVPAPAQVPKKPAAPPPAAPLPPPGERAPLNRGAAIAALGAAASRTASCRRPDGPSGSGRASVTFSPDGPVASVSVPGKFAGTQVGECVAAQFRSARIPPFSGSPVTLSQSFNVPE
jgi:serine/threonine-protein kinase